MPKRTNPHVNMGAPPQRDTGHRQRGYGRTNSLRWVPLALKTSAPCFSNRIALRAAIGLAESQTRSKLFE